MSLRDEIIAAEDRRVFDYLRKLARTTEEETHICLAGGQRNDGMVGAAARNRRRTRKRS